MQYILYILILIIPLILTKYLLLNSGKYKEFKNSYEYQLFKIVPKFLLPATFICHVFSIFTVIIAFLNFKDFFNACFEILCMISIITVLTLISIISELMNKVIYIIELLVYMLISNLFVIAFLYNYSYN